MEPVNAPIEPDQNDRAAAREVKRLVKQAAFFLILWLFGIGSVIAVLNGLKARKLIVQSKGRIPGMEGALMCISLGVIEIAIWIKFIATGSFL